MMKSHSQSMFFCFFLFGERFSYDSDSLNLIKQPRVTLSFWPPASTSQILRLSLRATMLALYDVEDGTWGFCAF